MKLLLDTHVWVWCASTSSRLGPRARRAIESTANEIWISPISTWEVILLSDRGRLSLDPDPISWLRAAFAAVPARETPLNHSIAIASRRIDLPHDDPADRFLAATAKFLDLTLVTADERLLGCREIKTLRA